MKHLHKHLFLLLLLTVCCSACISTMKVKVDIIDRQKLITAPEVLLMEVLAISEVEQGRLSRQFYQKQRDEIADAFDALIMTLVQENRIGLNVQPIVSASLRKEIDDVYLRQVIPEISAAIITTQTFFSEKASKEAGLTDRQLDAIYDAKGKFTNAKQQLNSFALKWSRLQADWMTAIRKPIEEAPELSMNFYKNIINPPLESALQANDPRRYLETLHNGLYDDPLNSFITQAPREYWRKMYNKTVAKNLLGDTDIAVVMETPGNFFIKGVRMDAENVTKHLANTFNTSVRFLGKVNGLDMGTRKPKATETTSTESAVINEEVKTRKAAQQIEVREKITKLSMINLMDAIIAQKDSLASDTGYSQALEQIKSIYTVHKSQLETVQKSQSETTPKQ